MGAVSRPLGILFWAEFVGDFVRVGKGIFQPKGLAIRRKKTNRPTAMPKTTKRTGDILPDFIY